MELHDIGQWAALAAAVIAALGYIQNRARVGADNARAVAVLNERTDSLQRQVDGRRKDMSDHEDLHDAQMPVLTEIRQKVATIEADVKHLTRDVDDLKRRRGGDC